MSIHRRTTKNGQVRYDVRLYRPDGREYSKTFRTRREAERFQATEQADRARGTWLDPQAGSITFTEWADEWSAANSHSWRPRTTEKHEMALRVHWKPRLGQQAPSAIRPRQIQAIVNDLVTQGYSSASIQTYLEPSPGCSPPPSTPTSSDGHRADRSNAHPSAPTKSLSSPRPSFTGWPTQ